MARMKAGISRPRKQKTCKIVRCRKNKPDGVRCSNCVGPKGNKTLALCYAHKKGGIAAANRSGMRMF